MNTFTPSAKFVDAVSNHPAVRATIDQGCWRVRSYGVITDSRNRVIAFEGGYALFLGLGEGLYEGHVAALPGSRGAAALAFGKVALQWLFADVEAHRVVVPVPVQLPAARTYCRRLGLKPDGRDLFQEYFSTEAVAWAG